MIRKTLGSTLNNHNTAVNYIEIWIDMCTNTLNFANNHMGSSCRYLLSMLIV